MGFSHEMKASFSQLCLKCDSISPDAIVYPIGNILKIRISDIFNEMEL
jgi:hypothetical protein